MENKDLRTSISKAIDKFLVDLYKEGKSELDVLTEATAIDKESNPFVIDKIYDGPLDSKEFDGFDYHVWNREICNATESLSSVVDIAEVLIGIPLYPQQKVLLKYWYDEELSQEELELLVKFVPTAPQCSAITVYHPKEIYE
jgi:hypothetical protein